MASEEARRAAQKIDGLYQYRTATPGGHVPSVESIIDAEHAALRDEVRRLDAENERLHGHLLQISEALREGNVWPGVVDGVKALRDERDALRERVATLEQEITKFSGWRRIADENSTLREQLRVAVEALEAYEDPGNWDSWRSHRFLRGAMGATIAAAALAKIRGGADDAARFHDPYAIPAIEVYAAACEAEYPELSRDLWTKAKAARTKTTESEATNGDE